MKKPAAPSTAAVAPAILAPVPHAGGSYIRLPDGSLQLEESTDNSPEARAAAVEDPVQSPVKEA